MSGGTALRKPLDWLAINDSRNAAQLGRTFHIPALTAEAKHNEQNPGRAETKGAINAALWFLGGEAGSALGGGDAGSAAGDTAGAVGSGATAAGEGFYNGMTAAQIAQQLAPIAEGENVGSAAAGLLSGGGDSAMTAAQLGKIATADSLNMGLLGTGGTPSAGQVVQQAALNNMAPVQDLSIQARSAPVRLLQDYAARAKTGLSNEFGGLFQRPTAVGAQQDSAPLYEQSVQALKSGSTSGSGAKNLAMQMGMKMLEPQQPRPMPQAPPAPPGPQGPLTNPYQNPYGPGGNSLGLTEEQKRRLRAAGYQV